MIPAILDTIWREESLVTARDPYQGRRLNISSSTEVYAGLETSQRGRFVAFRLTDDQRRSIRDRLPRSSSGILVESVAENFGVVAIFLREQPNAPETVFRTVAIDVIEVLVDASPKTALRAAFERFSLWQKALQRRTGPMSGTEVRGVIGELLVLRDVLAPVVGLHAALSAWAAPESKGIHDFAGRDWELEVKSLLAPGNSIHVNVTGQLESTEGRPVFLLTVELEPAGDGFCLLDLLSELEGLAREQRALHATLQSALVMRGARSQALDGEAAVRYRVNLVRYFHIAETFPIIRRASMPFGASEVQYLIDLSACANFSVSSETILHAISTPEHQK